MSEREILDKARAFPSEAERAAFLESACRGDASLRRRIENLLSTQQSGEGTSDFDSVEGGSSGLNRTAIAEGPGTIVGPYKLLQQIGEGGFGVVFMAEQASPVRRMVAIKILKPGMDTAQVVARFESERQALAMMDHPNIAKVLDAGATESGRPYFVMELVKGVPITRFCDQHHLSTEQRLNLFIDICHAIQHAHHKGVIHRDIKPSNVMVTLHDGVPVVKVIDFGVAKATLQKLTEKTLFTAYGQMIGTPAYVSPEQAEMSGLDIDTRSDVYSLGVLLYELLTGTTPLEAKRLREAGYAEMQRIIREDEPPRPSTRLSSLGDSATPLAESRGTDIRKLVKLLARDLDWIVMKALEKDRNRRYSTSDKFAEDIERYLNNEAILARPPSTSYRLKKFVRRNRAAVIMSFALVALLLVGIVGTSVGLYRSRAAEKRTEIERQRADENFRQARQAIDEFYVRFSRQLADQPGAQPLRKDLLETGLKFYARFLEDHGQDPGLRAEVAMTYWRIGRIRTDLGEPLLAIDAYRKGAEIQESLLAEQPTSVSYRADLAATFNNLSMLLASQGQAAEGIRLVERGLALRQQVSKESPGDLSSLSDVAGAWNNLGILLDNHGEPKRAIEAYQHALEIRQDLASRKPESVEYLSDLSMSHNNLGAWYYIAGEDANSLRHYEQSLKLRERLQQKHPKSLAGLAELAKCHHNIGLLHHRSQRWAEATLHQEKSRDLVDVLVRGSPAVPEYRRSLADAYRSLGITYHSQDKLRESVAAFKRCFEIRSGLAEEYPSHRGYQRELAQAASNLGAIYQKTNEYKDAIEPAERAVIVYRSLLKPDPSDADILSSYARACTNLGAIRSDLGQPKAALEILDVALATYQQLTKSRPGNIKLLEEATGAWSNRSLAFQKLERWDEAIACCVEWSKILHQILTIDPTAASIREELGQCYLEMARMHLRLKRPDQAAEAALQCQAAVPGNPATLYNVACELAKCAALVGPDSPDLTPKQRTERDRYVGAAIQALRQAIMAGYKDAAHLAKDTDLDSIRSRPEFKVILSDLEASKGRKNP